MHKRRYPRIPIVRPMRRHVLVSTGATPMSVTQVMYLTIGPFPKEDSDV